jgi:putative chitinase
MKTITTFISKEALLSIVKKTSLVEIYYPILVFEMDKYAINNKNRVCAFLAQILHESGCFYATKENLYYTATGLMKVWPSKFKTLEFAKTFEKQPEKIANYVYGGRMGNNAEGDGWKYIGRGVIGVTGKDNYAALSKDTGIDFVKNPELLELPDYAVISAINFWNKYKLNDKADAGDFKGITQRINGGQIGAEDRTTKYNQLLALAKEVTVEVDDHNIKA